jgi:hypothetical protein
MTVTLPISGVTVNVDFDPAEMDARYAEEHRVRIKPEGIGQFNGLGDVLPYTDRDFDREVPRTQSRPSIVGATGDDRVTAFGDYLQARSAVDDFQYPRWGDQSFDGSRCGTVDVYVWRRRKFVFEVSTRPVEEAVTQHHTVGCEHRLF